MINKQTNKEKVIKERRRMRRTRTNRIKEVGRNRIKEEAQQI